MARKRIDESTRQKVMDAHARGLSMRTIAAECGVSLASVSRIVNEKTSQEGPKKDIGGERGKTERQRKIEALERRLAQLEKKILEAEMRNLSTRR